MITLIGGPLRQWDIDRQVKVLNKNITTLQFCNQHHCSPHEVAVVDGMAIMPNALLQIAQEVEIYGLAGDETVYSCRLDVNSRQKPSDYPIEESSSGGASGGGSSEPDVIINGDDFTYEKGDFETLWTKLENGEMPKVLVKFEEDLDGYYGNAIVEVKHICSALAGRGDKEHIFLEVPGTKANSSEDVMTLMFDETIGWGRPLLRRNVTTLPITN